MYNYEYISFINEKVLEFLPSSFSRHGDKYYGKCPICGDSHKSNKKTRGSYYMKTASYYCFNCGASLSGIKFLKYISGENFQEIHKEYIKIFLKSGLSTTLSSVFKIPENESIFDLKPMVKPEWKQKLSESAIQYLNNRLVFKSPFFKDKLYSWKNKKNQDYILIPWTINGIEAYFQLNDYMKNGSLKYIFPKNEKKIVAGLDNIDISWPYIIIFEGYFDSIFVKNGICVGTKSITDYQIQLIKQRFPHHQICISFDNDKSGIESMIKLIKKNTCFKFFKWFDKTTKQKDINDYIQSIQNVNAFSNEKILEKMIIDKLSMKMWLITNNYWI